jgi:transitional endoplasmic reticulum ATPase
VGGTSGESEERIRQIFEAAAAQAPSVLFIDSLDVLAGKVLLYTTVTVNGLFITLLTPVSGFFARYGATDRGAAGEQH